MNQLDERHKLQVQGAEKKTCAEEMLEVTQALAKRATFLVESFGEKLSPVISNQRIPVQPGVGEDEEDVPPLFHEMRVALFEIESSLDALDNMRDRVEI